MANAGSSDLEVEIIERVVVAPCLPSPRTILPLSAIDNRVRGFGSVLLFYNGSSSVSADPAKIIREALSKMLVYYFPFAGRLRNKENGDLEVECTGEGAVFVEAMADTDLSSLGNLDAHNPSFHQLSVSPPVDSDIEGLHLAALQVTHFTCGGFVLGVSLNQSVCDGKGLGNFLKGLAEMVRGQDKPSIEPVWNREIVKFEDYTRLQFYHHEFIQPSLIDEKIVQTSLVINLETINIIKRCIMEEYTEFFSTFEIVAAMVWLARTKAFKIPHSENAELLFTMDMRESFNPPLPKGYYGNVMGIVCALDNVKDLLSGSILRAAMVIKKSRFFFTENFRLGIMTQPSALTVKIKHKNVVACSDWRQFGYDEVDFGWGNAVNVIPMQIPWENEFGL
ncbi:hypothetical protein KI387_005027, partial [Taxus chinensis]